MRVLALLCLLTRVARADSDVTTAEPRWEIRESAISVGHPDAHAYVGLMVALEHRLDERLWVGVTVAGMVTREQTPDHMPLPMQTAWFAAAAARYELGRTAPDRDGDYLSGELRGELGAGLVRYDQTQSTPGIGSVGLVGRASSRTLAMMVSIGVAGSFAGSGTGIDPWGIDVRIGGARRW